MENRVQQSANKKAVAFSKVEFLHMICVVSFMQIAQKKQVEM